MINLTNSGIVVVVTSSFLSIVVQGNCFYYTCLLFMILMIL